MELLHNLPITSSASLPAPFPSPPHPHHNALSSNTTPSTRQHSNPNAIVVETRLKKIPISFTANFVGLSGFLSSNHNGSIASPIVEVHDLAWSVHLTLNNGPFIGCAVYLETPDTSTRATYRLSLVNQMGWKNHSVLSDSVKSVTTTGTSKSCLCHEAKFISREDLKNSASGHCVDDTVIVMVDLMVFSQEEKRILQAPPKPLSISTVSNATAENVQSNTLILGSLIDDMHCLLFNPVMADVHIIVPKDNPTLGRYSEEEPSDLPAKDKVGIETLVDTSTYVTIPAHSFVLSLRSPVFRAMLQSEMQEALTRKITLHDCSEDSVRDFLSFLYTDRCNVWQNLSQKSISSSDSPDLILEHIEELLILACKYDVNRLQALCEQDLVQRMSVENVACLLRLADDYGAVRLKKAALNYIACNAPIVTEHPAFFESLSKELSFEVIRAMAGLKVI